MATVYSIMEKWLEEHGYDGLVNRDDDCWCSRHEGDDLPLFNVCDAGYPEAFPACRPGHKRVLGTDPEGPGLACG